jgi:hypothetical protein
MSGSLYARAVQAEDAGTALHRLAILCALAADVGLMTREEGKRLGQDVLTEEYGKVRDVIDRLLKEVP